MKLIGAILVVVWLAGCSAPDFTDAVYLHKDKPGPVEQAKRAALQKRIDDDHAMQVKKSAMQGYYHMMATNTLSRTIPRDATKTKR